MHRRRWFVALSALAFQAFLTGPTWADVGFLPRSNLNIRVCFENLEECPDYDFYLKYGLGRSNPYASLHLTRVHPGEPTLLEGTGSRMTVVYLVAVPRGQSMYTPSEDEGGGTWLTETPNSALQSAPLPGNTSGARLSARFNGYLIHYRIHIEDDRLKVTCVDTESPKPWLGTLLGGLGLGVVTAAVVLVWRRRFGPPVHKADAAEAAADPSFH